MKPGIRSILSDSQHAQVTQATFDQEHVGMAIADVNGRIQQVNRALANMLGYSQEELIGTRLKDLARPAGNRQDPAPGKEYKSGEKPPLPSVNHLERKSGGTIACAIDSRGLYGENGKLTHFLMFVVGIQSREDAEETQLPESDIYRSQALQTMGMLAGGVAHDFNNALEVIIGFTSLARIRLSPSDPLNEPLKIIEESAKGAGNLARQLLEASKDKPEDEGPVNVAELVETVLSIITRTFDRKIRIENRIAPQLPGTVANRGRLEQAILNLCINARDAMPRGGRLAIKACLQTLKSGDGRLPSSNRPGDYVRISVCDTGEGMQAEILEKIFVPQFTTKGPGKGFGMGLAMVDRIVKESGGFISVTTKPRKGSEFSVYFPAVCAGRAKPAHSRPDQMISGRGGVLVVDDEPRVLEFLEKGLTRLGYEVVTAENGSKACEIYSKKNREINCVLLDLIMPGMSGLEAYSRLKSINPGVRVILSSGYSSGRIRLEAGAAGGLEFLEKPYTLEELSQALQKFQQN